MPFLRKVILKGNKFGIYESIVLDKLSLRCVGGIKVEKYSEYMNERLRKGMLARDTYLSVNHMWMIFDTMNGRYWPGQKHNLRKEQSLRESP